MKNRLKEFRKRRGWKQADLALISDLGQSMIAQVEGGALPSLETAQALATVLGETLDTIFPGLAAHREELWRKRQQKRHAKVLRKQQSEKNALEQHFE